MRKLLLLLLVLPLLLGAGPITGGPISGGGGGGGTALPANAPGSLINDGAGMLSWGVPGTATALAANGTNCVAGQAPLGVNASGNAEGCWAVQPYDAQLVDVAGLANPGDGYGLIWSGGNLTNTLAPFKTWPATASKIIWNDAGGDPTATAANQTANYAYAGPASGAAAAPTFRALVDADIPVVTTTVSTGAINVTTKSAYVICTGACQVTLPAAVAGQQYCVRNAPGSATIITLVNRASQYYELTNHTAWATVNQKLVSGGVATDSICVVGYDSTHYVTMNSTGTWTDTAP